MQRRKIKKLQGLQQLKNKGKSVSRKRSIEK